MGIAMKWAPMLLLAAAASVAQPLRVYSEYAEINARGEVVAPESPREILSPAMVRNGFTSFQVVIQAPKGTPFTLYVGQNPAEAVKITLYRASGGRLERVELPYESDSTQILWMDLWTDREAPVRRVKIEPELFIDGDWVVYPMEARVVEATVPDGKRPEGEGGAFVILRRSICGARSTEDSAGGIYRMHFRNAQQDLALAARAPKEDVRKLVCDAAPSSDPESYLKIRDYLLRLR
jgi:hypothetical protein